MPTTRKQAKMGTVPDSLSPSTASSPARVTLPLEITTQVAEHLLANRQGATLSCLARASKQTYNAVIPILHREITIPHSRLIDFMAVLDLPTYRGVLRSQSAGQAGRRGNEGTNEERLFLVDAVERKKQLVAMMSSLYLTGETTGLEEASEALINRMGNRRPAFPLLRQVNTDSYLSITFNARRATGTHQEITVHLSDYSMPEAELGSLVEVLAKVQRFHVTVMISLSPAQRLKSPPPSGFRRYSTYPYAPQCIYGLMEVSRELSYLWRHGQPICIIYQALAIDTVWGDLTDRTTWSRFEAAQRDGPHWLSGDSSDFDNRSVFQKITFLPPRETVSYGPHRRPRMRLYPDDETPRAATIPQPFTLYRRICWREPAH